MLSLSLLTMLKLYKTTSPIKLFDYDCVTLYYVCMYVCIVCTKWIIGSVPLQKYINRKIQGKNSLFLSFTLEVVMDHSNTFLPENNPNAAAMQRLKCLEFLLIFKYVYLKDSFA